MNAQLVSGAIAGGLQGLSTSYEAEKQQQDAMQLAEMRGQVQQMLATLNNTTKENIAGTRADASTQNAGTRADAARDVAGTAADSRRDVANINQTGATGRNDATLDFKYTKQGQDDARGYYGIDSRADTAAAAEKGRDARWATPSANNNQSTATARRGQDLSFSLGADRAAVTQRGQDINLGLGNNRNTIANGRASIFSSVFGPDAGGGAPAAPAPVTPVTAPPVITPGSGGAAPAGAAPVPRAPIPVTSRPAAGGGAAAASPKALDVLTQQAQAALAAYKAETDPAKKQQLAAQLTDLKRRRDALVGTPTPGGGGDE